MHTVFDIHVYPVDVSGLPVDAKDETGNKQGSQKTVGKTGRKKRQKTTTSEPSASGAEGEAVCSDNDSTALCGDQLLYLSPALV